MISFFSKNTAVRNMEWLGVDVHSHLLPGIDDGAEDVMQSVHFIKTLNELGFDEFICTPHIFTELYPNNSGTIMRALHQVRFELEKIYVSVKVNAAAEYMIDETFRISETLLCLPGKYILVEMSYLTEVPNIFQVIMNLQDKGYNVILAHPERYGFYHKQPDKYGILKEMGVLFQLNLLSVNGYYGKAVKQAANYLLSKKNYDLAATDLHHQRHLDVLKSIISNGSLHKMIGHYPFRNKDLFSSKK